MGKSKKKEPSNKNQKKYIKTSRTGVNQKLREINKFGDLEEFDIEDEIVIVESYD